MTVSRPGVLSGDRTTWPLHLGHFAGSLKARVELRHHADQYLLLAGLQALTDNAGEHHKVAINVIEVALDYLAVGIRAPGQHRQQGDRRRGWAGLEPVTLSSPAQRHSTRTETMKTPRADVLVKSLAVVAVLFGLLTVFSGGRTLFGGEAARLAAGVIVPFVLWFNFGAGFAYVACGWGLWGRRRWSVPLAVVIAVATGLVFAAFAVHALSGGAYEARTVGAMALRTLLWAGIAWTAHRAIRLRA